ncbi:Asp23/Gls24 family envelope stress response protein [Streptomyces sp. NPDC021093]|uniref:Asp23/Gls24 family envelope stress response protein n=1 Tax=Streptomyces sp. NPDC021093 TaxID=3365112 RepID=UPI0037B94966
MHGEHGGEGGQGGRPGAAGPVPRETPRETGERLARAVAEAAVRVPGVAFLRPRLSDLIRGAAAVDRLRGKPAGDRAPAGVRARRDPDTARWQVEVQLTVRHGHRAVDVAREVRAAGERAVAGTPVEIAVTVAGIA